MIMSAIRAIYEKGVFRPLGPVDLPEKAQVEFEPRVVNAAAAPSAAMARLYVIMSRRDDAGADDLAERHNEHQP
jgi:predicted DNA-binding antitoxin AbrB/MazE fold protein